VPKTHENQYDLTGRPANLLIGWFKMFL